MRKIVAGRSHEIRPYREPLLARQTAAESFNPSRALLAGDAGAVLAHGLGNDVLELRMRSRPSASVVDAAWGLQRADGMLGWALIVRLRWSAVTRNTTGNDCGVSQE
jgi:hypothetical protein